MAGLGAGGLSGKTVRPLVAFGVKSDDDRFTGDLRDGGFDDRRLSGRLVKRDLDADETRAAEELGERLGIVAEDAVDDSGVEGEGLDAAREHGPGAE